MYDLIVIGGGPAGMLGAATAGARGLKVLLAEKNDRPGRKLAITGNGRCNVTNSGGIDDFQRNIVSNGRFLYGALAGFDSRHLIALLNVLGVKVKVEQGGRVFPVSDRAGDVVEALQRHLRSNKVELKTGARVKEVMVRDNRVSGVLLADNSRLNSSNVLLATGGMSYKHTGSTGDGYDMARQLGHTIIEPRPALTPLVASDQWVKPLQGVSLENIKIQALPDPRLEQTGELLFTHFGISGPAVLNLSSWLGSRTGYPVKVKIDLFPSLSNEQLAERLRLCFRQNAGKLLKNSLSELLPRRMIQAVLSIAEVSPDKQVDQLSRAELLRLTHTLKNIILHIKGTRPLNESIVTGGGVSTAEINPTTMESKIVKGLYFAGEIIDVDALTGGYNLQIAFATGYLSGAGAASIS
ncbi:MAG: NAD(P)/FAD-dependent oxidoreductase [Peptococcaceae bacterium]|nr:NAD(P)/FAD-dependent oxidoreductase [Peptococcaceae bacterium]